MAGLVEASHVLSAPTRGKGFVEITRAATEWLQGIGADGGLVTVFVAHTSASLTIQENADPNVRLDLLDALEIWPLRTGTTFMTRKGRMTCRATSRRC